MTHRRVTMVVLLSLVAADAHGVPGPWPRTEARQPCASFETFRRPYSSGAEPSVPAGRRVNHL